MATQHFITAIERNTDTDSLFTIFQTSEERARKRAAQWQQDIDTGAWQQWSSKSKREAVGDAIRRGARVTVHYGVAL